MVLWHRRCSGGGQRRSKGNGFSCQFLRTSDAATLLMTRSKCCATWYSRHSGAGQAHAHAEGDAPLRRALRRAPPSRDAPLRAPPLRQHNATYCDLAHAPVRFAVWGLPCAHAAMLATTVLCSSSAASSCTASGLGSSSFQDTVSGCGMLSASGTSKLALARCRARG